MTDLVEAMARAIFERGEHRCPWADCDKYFFKLDGQKCSDFYKAMASNALTAIEASGYRVVPVEMTEEQYEALSATGKMWRELNSREVYRTLLAAAPKVTPK